MLRLRLGSKFPSDEGILRAIHVGGSSAFWPGSRFLAVSDILLPNPIMKRHVLIFGVVGGLLIATLQYTEYRFVVIEHSVELYSALVAILFAAFGIWLGLRITRRRETIRETVVVKEVLVPAEGRAPFAPNTIPFAPNTVRQQTLWHHRTRCFEIPRSWWLQA